MRSRLAATAAAVAITVALAPGGAQAQEIPYVSGPGAGSGTNFTVPVLVIPEGTPVTYTNLDIALHDVRSVGVRTDPEDFPAWCTEGFFDFAPGQCPLFTSILIGLGQTDPVRGIEEMAPLPPGETYEFVCTIHNWMWGHVVVLPA